MAIVMIGYPAAIYASMSRYEPYWLAVGLLALSVARAVATRERFWFVAGAGAAVLALLALLENSWAPLKLYPVIVNALLLAVFGFSLLRPPSAIERLARLSKVVLSPAAISYTRWVTGVWSVFFLFNGSVALATALWASAEVWALYNGFIAYVLIGALFGGEWLVRRRVQARLDAGGEHA